MTQLLTEKQQFWTEQLRNAEQSGQSLADYARAHNIPAQKLYQWRSTLRKQVTTSVMTETQFAQVVHPPTMSNALIIHLTNAELRFSSLPDATWLTQVLHHPSLQR